MNLRNVAIDSTVNAKGATAAIEVRFRSGVVAVVAAGEDGYVLGAEFADRATIAHLIKLLTEAANEAGLK